MKRLIPGGISRKHTRFIVLTLFLLAFSFRARSKAIFQDTEIDSLGRKAVSLLAQAQDENRKGNNGDPFAPARQARKIFRRIGDQKGEFQSEYLIAGLHQSRQNFGAAVAHYLEALSKSEKLDGLHTERFDILLKLAIDFRRFDQPENAWKYARRGLEVAKKAGDDRYAGLFSMQIGILHANRREFEAALSAYQKSELYFKASRSDDFLISAQTNIGIINMELGRFEEALIRFEKTKRYFREKGDNKSLLKAIWDIGFVYLKQGKNGEAEKKFFEGLALAESLGKFDKSWVLQKIADFYYRWNRYKEAYEYHLAYLKLKEKLFNEEQRKNITALQEKYQAQKRLQEIELLKKQKQIETYRRNILAGIILAGFILLAFLLKKFHHLLLFWKREKIIGRYRLQEAIGHGAMGIVYRAQSLQDRNETVAVKVLRSELMQDTLYVERFKREGTVIDRLDHPHIIRIFERGLHQNRYYLAMEYLAGIPLDRWMAKNKERDISACIPIMIQIASALQAIHQRHIVHRDLKPANIMVLEKEGNSFHIKLLDFGLSRVIDHTRLTESGTFIGTIGYQAPECFRDREYSTSADVYAMGVIFYELATGKYPFFDESLARMLENINRMTPPAPAIVRADIPPFLNFLLIEMLEKEPSRRPSADKTLRRLQTVSCRGGEVSV